LINWKCEPCCDPMHDEKNIQQTFNFN
jgi:hypothetical protein